MELAWFMHLCYQKIFTGGAVMAITRWKKDENYDPWAEFKSLQNEINDLFNVDRYPSTTGLFDRSFSPAVDVLEREHGFSIICELPGMKEEDIDVSIASNVLTIKGAKHEDKEAGKGRYYKKESWAGTFQRTLPLPVSVDADKISAEFKNGVLDISAPKKEEAKPKQISVKVK